MRAETRCIQRFISGVTDLQVHRGCKPSRLGLALAAVLAGGATYQADREDVVLGRSDARDCGVQTDDVLEFAAARPATHSAPAYAAETLDHRVIVGTWEALPPAFRVVIKARVREAPSDAANTLELLAAGSMVRGWPDGRWLALVPGPGYVRAAYEDGESIVESVSSGDLATDVG